MNRLEEAIGLALTLHAGQTDKAGQPYILHPLRVMLAVAVHGEDSMMAAILHDTVEDTGWSLRGKVGPRFGKTVSDAVDAVTRRPNEDYGDFILRAAKDRIGRLVKIADLEDNLRSDRLGQLPPAERARLESKYTAALRALTSPEIRGHRK